MSQKVSREQQGIELDQAYSDAEKTLQSSYDLDLKILGFLEQNPQFESPKIKKWMREQSLKENTFDKVV